MASYASRQSVAIDFQRFASTHETPEDAPRAAMEVLPQPARRRKNPGRARTPYGKYVAVALCVFGVLAVMLTSYMRVNELSVQNDRLAAAISALEGRESALNAKKEQLYNLAFVEDYAKNVLGMVKLDKSEIHYVELSNPERMTAAAPDADAAGQVSALARGFNAVLEYLN
jgi:cell division protein FtsB